MDTMCPMCLEYATIRVDLDDGETATCDKCDETYAVSDVRLLVASWGPLLAWLDSHPAKKQGG